MDINDFMQKQIDGFFSDLFYYGRKEDDVFKVGMLEDYFRSGATTVDEWVAEFRKQLERNVSHLS